MKRLHITWFQLYNILEKAKLWREYKDQLLPQVGGEGGMNMWGTEDFYGNETILYDTLRLDMSLYIGQKP